MSNRRYRLSDCSKRLYLLVKHSLSRFSLSGAHGSTSGSNHPPLPHAMASREGGKRWRRPYAQWPHTRGAGLALRLSDPPNLPLTGRTVRGGRYNGYRLPWHGHMGAAHETLASQRDPPRDAERERKTQHAKLIIRKAALCEVKWNLRYGQGM